MGGKIKGAHYRILSGFTMDKARDDSCTPQGNCVRVSCKLPIVMPSRSHTALLCNQLHSWEAGSPWVYIIPQRYALKSACFPAEPWHDHCNNAIAL